MTPSTTVLLPGAVRSNAIVLDNALPLPDGARVGIRIRLDDLDPNLAAEMAAWDLAGDDAWAMIEEWERAEA